MSHAVFSPSCPSNDIVCFFGKDGDADNGVFPLGLHVFTPVCFPVSFHVLPHESCRLFPRQSVKARRYPAYRPLRNLQMWPLGAVVNLLFVLRAHWQLALL